MNKNDSEEMQYRLENYSERAGNKTAPLNLSTPPKVDYIATRMTPGIVNHQCLNRPCKESL